jgi:hypothetical protein
LSESEFAEAVRDALRDYARASAFRNNPLLRSRLVANRAGMEFDTSKRITSLQTLLEEAAESLQQSPREAKLYRALYHTYLLFIIGAQVNGHPRPG